MKRFLVLLILFFLVGFFTEGQVTFQKTYGGNSSYFSCVKQTTDNGYVGTGWIRNFPASRNDVFVVKTDSIGVVEWSKSYGYLQNTGWEGTSVQQTYDNGFIILGHTSGGPSYSDFYLIKLNYFGDTLWTRRYGGALHDIGKSVIQTSDSGYLMTGESFSFSQGDVNLYLIKTNEQGDTLWTRAYGGLDSDAGYSIVQSYDMNYLIAGFTTSSFQNAGLCLLKINQTGDSLWTKVFDKCYLGNCIIQAKDSSIIVVGESAGVGLGNSDIYMAKVDTVGNIIWERSFGGSGDDRGYSVCQSLNGDYVVTGYTESFSSNRDFYLIKTNENGDTIFTKTFGGTYLDETRSVQATNDGGLVLGGYWGFSSNDGHACIIKLDSLGSLNCDKGKMVNTVIGNLTSSRIFVNNNYSSTNTVAGIPQVIEETLIADSIICIFNLVTYPNEPIFFLSPNPASTTFTITTALSAINSIDIFNMLGEKVTGIRSVIAKAEMDMDVSNLNPGIYFVKVETERGTSVQKLVKQ